MDTSSDRVSQAFLAGKVRLPFPNRSVDLSWLFSDFVQFMKMYGSTIRTVDSYEGTNSYTYYPVVVIGAGE